jgi:hypothetical protein
VSDLLKSLSHFRGDDRIGCSIADPARTLSSLARLTHGESASSLLQSATGLLFYASSALPSRQDRTETEQDNLWIKYMPYPFPVATGTPPTELWVEVTLNRVKKS